MRILAFSDPHFTCNSEFNNPTEDGYNEYLQSCIKSFDFVGGLVQDLNPGVLAFCGDCWDSQDYIDAMSLNAGLKAWEKLSSISDCKKFAVIGNHDLYSADHNIHNLEFLKSLGWHVFESPSMVSAGSLSVLGVPYRSSYDKESLSRINRLAPDIVLTHCDVIGAQRRAVTSRTDSKAFSQAGLPVSIFNQSGIVLNGHYHMPSKVGSNWYNVGALTARTFQDKDSAPRGVMQYDTETRSVTQYANPHAREFTDIFLEDEEDLSSLDEDYSNTYARIYYNLDLEDEAQAACEMFAGTRLMPVVKKRDEVNAISVDFRFSLEENLRQFVEERYSDSRLTELSLEILRIASEEYSANTSREPLEFRRVEIHNFQSVGHIELDLRDRGILFIKGTNSYDTGQDSNGSGKSSVIEGIYWCLTGKSLRGYRGNEVIHWDEEYVRVSLELLVGDRTYTIIRSRKDPDYGTGVYLLAGNRTAGARLTSSTESKIRDLIGRSEDSLKHVCFMTTGMSNRFTSLSYSQRARLLEDVIDSKPYSLSKQISDERLHDVVLELSRVRGSLDATLKSKDSTEERIAQLKSSIEGFDKLHEDDKQAHIDRERELEASIAADERAERRVGSEIDALEEKLKGFRSKRAILESEANSKADEIAGISSQVAVIESDLKRLGSLKNQDLCPTCEHPVNQGVVSTDFNAKYAIKDSLDLLLWELRGIHENTISRIKKIDVLVAARDELRLLKTRERSALHYSVENSNEELKEVRSYLSDIDSSRDKLDSQLAEREKELERLHPQLSDLMDEEERLEADERLYGILAKEVFNEEGVRNSILSQIAVPYINSRIPIYSQFLWEGRSIELVGYRDLKSGKTKNHIDISLGSDHTYKGNSSGERRRVDLIIQLALNDLAAATGRSRVGLLVVDEAFDTLDDVGIFAAVESLRQKDAGTVLIVSHRKYAASICSNKISVVKEGRYTRLGD